MTRSAKQDSWDMVVSGIPFCHSVFGIPSIHSLPEGGSWERQYAPPALHWLHHAHPFVAATEKNVSHAEKQSVWSSSCVLQDMLRPIQWLCPSTGNWLRPQSWHVTAANQRTLFEIELLATVGWKWGCQPFSCRCSQNVTNCNRRFVGHASFQESLPAIHFGYSKHSLPSLQLQKRNVSHAKKQSVWSRSYGFKICYNTVIVLSVVLWDCCKPTNTFRD